MYCGHLSKSCQNVQNSDFQNQFSMSKMIRILFFFFIEEEQIFFINNFYSNDSKQDYKTF